MKGVSATLREAAAPGCQPPANRIGVYFKRITSGGYFWGDSWDTYQKLWKQLTAMMKGIMESTWKSLYTSSKIDEPKEVTDDDPATSPTS